MSSEILLSICIPTYNREKYLRELLDNIFHQLNNIKDSNVEICISDNASTDNTQQMVFQYQKTYTNINYFRWDKNMGADNNYLKVVEIAHGEYCWLFGSDDMISNGGIAKILSEIKENHDIYLVNNIVCDINMKPLKKSEIIKHSIKTKVFNFNTDNNLLYYLKSLNNNMGIFTYLSAIIVKKRQWNLINFDISFIGSAYAHSYILLSMLKNNITLKYIDAYIVLYRGCNDSFAMQGMVNRIRIDCDGYKILFTTVFNKKNSKIINYYKDILKKTWSYNSLSSIYEMLSDNNDRELLISITKETHNYLLIYSISFFYYMYRKFFKKFLQKMNIHQKLVELLFYK
ncbi:MAG: glycosyltransferase family 2 protein [Endomicrobiaceae bacterium]